MQLEVAVGNNRKGDRINDDEIIDCFIIVSNSYTDNFNFPPGFGIRFDHLVEVIIGACLPDTVWAVSVEYFNQNYATLNLLDGEGVSIDKPQIGTLSSVNRSWQRNFGELFTRAD